VQLITDKLELARQSDAISMHIPLFPELQILEGSVMSRKTVDVEALDLGGSWNESEGH
jgi:hypothetical protein